MFPQPQGMGKGGFRNLHPDTTLGAMFNANNSTWIKKALMSIIYGTLNLIFSSILDKDLAIALSCATTATWLMTVGDTTTA